MDFRFSEDQIMVRDLSRGILEKELTQERLRQVEAEPDWFDRGLWSRLGEAHLLGTAVTDELGGAGFGFSELCMLLHETGRAVAPIPVLHALTLGGLPIAQFGTDSQKERWLPGLAKGEILLTGALVDANSTDPERPATRARRQGDGWVLEGRKRFVSALHLAERVLVPARDDTGFGLFLVDPRAEGVGFERQRISTGEPLFELKLSGVRVLEEDRIGQTASGDSEIASWLHDRALIATCAMQLGVSERALEITAGYAKEREQFGVPIGSFQAVQHRAADCYIDLEAMRWVTWRAAWKLSRGLPARRESAVAKFWAAEAGARIAAAVQHLHAGLGVDLDYPIHRYFLWSKTLELSLGAALPQLARLGYEMVQTGPPEMP